ncbi:hypothetical protein K7W42_15380 [Deinococcus sp. HMF7604]|uniref:hypothetical protein n=1 Tax=Deinococcus betulae TaxID=2873312 RepID=UPI001CCCC3FB|nr:hypothetical protein [Deinococcus betulae]MBZ9752236.1 hypothetical protein [Deinococcus betulae]
MFSPLPIQDTFPRTDIHRIHLALDEEALSLLRRAGQQVLIYVIRLFQGVPVRALRAIPPEELDTHQLLPGTTAYALAFTFTEDGKARDMLVVVSPTPVCAPPDMGLHQIVHGTQATVPMSGFDVQRAREKARREAKERRKQAASVPPVLPVLPPDRFPKHWKKRSKRKGK